MKTHTVAVDIVRGRIVPKVLAELPANGSGVLTIQQPTPAKGGSTSMLKVLEALQQHLAMDARGAQRWQNAVRKARR